MAKTAKKKITKNLKRQKSVKVKKIFFTTKQARTSVALGNGFDRWDFYRNVAPNTNYTFTFFGGSLKPISAGWGNSLGYRTVDILSSYPSGTNNWIVRVYNTTTSTIPVGFFFITKS